MRSASCTTATRTAIHRFHTGRTRDPEAALDLTAETFAQAWLSRGRFRDLAGGSAGPWLYGIARHVLVASVRRHELERSASERLGLLARSEHAEPEQQWLDGLDEALAELSPELEEAVRLRIVEDLSYEDVARRGRHDAGRSAGARPPRPHVPAPTTPEGGTE